MERIKRMGRQLDRGVFAVFALLYAGVFFLIFFFNSSFTYSPFFQAVLLAAWSCVLTVFLLLWGRVRAFFTAHKYCAALIILAFIFAVQLVLGLQTVPNPMYDHGKVFWGASYYAHNGAEGEAFEVYEGYLHHYPNNMGLFLLQQLLFRITHLTGIDADYAVAAVAGHLLFFAALWMVFLFADEAFGTDTAFFTLVMAGFYLPVYFQSTVSYTDTWSIWGVPGILLFALRIQRAQNWKKRLWNGALVGLVAGVSMQIKVTVLIVLVALLFQWLLQGKLRRVLPALALAALLMLAVNAGFRQWGYATIVDPAREDEGLPTSHWLMMGLQQDGSYSWIDEWEITCSVAGKEARTQLHRQVIRERLQEMGVGGYLRLLGRKTCRSFGSGNADLRYSLLYEDNAKPINWLYEFVFEDGKYYAVFNNLSHSMYLMMLLLAITGAICEFRKKEAGQQSAVWLALVGFWVFMMLWESNHRQWINQWPLLFAAAAQGLELIRRRWFDRLSVKK